jgi:hypothetical protein
LFDFNGRVAAERSRSFWANLFVQNTFGRDLKPAIKGTGYSPLDYRDEHELHSYSERSVDGNDILRKSYVHAKKKRIYWLPLFAAVGFLLLAAAVAVGNHLYFQFLDKRPAENQKWITIYSLLLAFSVKVLLSLARYECCTPLIDMVHD